MIELIFNADDFGLSPSVNRSICQAVHAGLLKSVSLMVTHPAAQDGLAQMHTLHIPPRFGLHFSLTSGTAVSPADEIPLLADSTGHLKNGFLDLVRLFSSRNQSEAENQIEKEFSAQLALFDRLLASHPEYQVDHLDSHQHIHVFPYLLHIMKKTAAQRGWELRIPHESVGNIRRVFPSPLFHLKGILKKAILDHYIRKSLKRTDILSHTGYFGIIDSGRMTEEAIFQILKVIPHLAKRNQQNRFEINLHPWKINGEKDVVPETASTADKLFGRSPYRELEFNALVKNNPQLREKMSELGITASNFGTPAKNR